VNASSHIHRILLIDPNVLFRCGIVRLIESQPDMEVVGETGDSIEAARLVTHCHPDIILLELELNGYSGQTLVGLIKHQYPAMHVVFLTNNLDPEEILGCVLAGASGYLHKNITPEELFARLRGLSHGEAAISLTTVSLLMQRLSASNYAMYLRFTPHPDLTRRESEILTLVAQGMTNKKIGAALRISEHTVRNHLCSIYQKLNLQNRLQVAVYCVLHGLVDIDSIV